MCLINLAQLWSNFSQKKEEKKSLAQSPFDRFIWHSKLHMTVVGG